MAVLSLRNCVHPSPIRGFSVNRPRLTIKQIDEIGHEELAGILGIELPRPSQRDLDQDRVNILATQFMKRLTDQCIGLFDIPPQVECP